MKSTNNLTRAQQRVAVKHLRGAVAARICQWDHERALERIFDRELELGIPDLAAVVDDPSTLNEDSLRQALGEME